MSELDEELTETKIYAKAVKLLGEEEVKEFVKGADQALKDLIASNEIYIQKTTLETKNTDGYLKAKEVLKDLNGGLRETLTPHKVKNQLATTVLRMRKVK